MWSTAGKGCTKKPPCKTTVDGVLPGAIGCVTITTNVFSSWLMNVSNPVAKKQEASPASTRELLAIGAWAFSCVRRAW